MANRLLSRSSNFKSLLTRWSSDVKFQSMSIHRRSIIPSVFFTANSSQHSSRKSNWSCSRGRRILNSRKKFDGSSEDSYVNLQAEKMDGKRSSLNSMGKKWIPFVLVEARVGNIQRSFSACFSSVASDMSLEGSHRDESVNVSGNENLLGGRTLKLLSGSCYLPHPDKEETGGEDAHFICAAEQAIGVADGVGGWADLGVNAGRYARELMNNCIAAIREAPKGAIDPASVLEKAYLNTKSRGSSTACIIMLADGGIHAVNLGDSGFIVVRDGSTIFRSPSQQHDFNFTYQLESGNGSDLPSAAEVFKFPVAPGDVIVAGTDGLFDNLYNNDISGTVVHAIRIGLEPHATAQKIAALARQRAQDKDRQTPFSTAAQEAGFRYYGGKLDDITVVVSYVTVSSS